MSVFWEVCLITDSVSLTKHYLDSPAFFCFTFGPRPFSWDFVLFVYTCHLNQHKVFQTILFIILVTPAGSLPPDFGDCFSCFYLFLISNTRELHFYQTFPKDWLLALLITSVHFFRWLFITSFILLGFNLILFFKLL